MNEEIPLGIYKPPTKQQPEAITKPITKFKFDIPEVKYTQVIGMKRAKAILHKQLELPLKKPQDFEDFKMNKSVGIIMYGPPGTGKTFLAKAVCGELNIKMCYVTPSSIMSKYVGESGKKVEETFQGSKEKPAMLYIDR